LENTVTKRNDKKKKMKNSIRRKTKKARNWGKERNERMSSKGSEVGC
jgi:hypothetical protein